MLYCIYKSFGLQQVVILTLVEMLSVSVILYLRHLSSIWLWLGISSKYTVIMEQYHI